MPRRSGSWERLALGSGSLQRFVWVPFAHAMSLDLVPCNVRSANVWQGNVRQETGATGLPSEPSLVHATLRFVPLICWTARDRLLACSKCNNKVVSYMIGRLAVVSGMSHNAFLFGVWRGGSWQIARGIAPNELTNDRLCYWLLGHIAVRIAAPQMLFWKCWTPRLLDDGCP